MRRIIACALTLVMGAALFIGCGREELPQVSYEDYAVSAEAESEVSFYSTYADFEAGNFAFIYADALDESYLQTVQIIENPENPENLDWREVLINSGITNAEDFSMLLMSGAIDWKEVTLGEATFTFLAISAEGDDYAMGIAHHPDSAYGVMVYGDLLEEELLNNIEVLTVTADGFGLELGGKMPCMTFSDGGVNMQSYGVCWFETLDQIDAYLVAEGTGIRAADITESEESIIFAGLPMQVIGYGVNSKGNVFFSGSAKGMAYAEGIVELGTGGYLLVRFSQRTFEGKVSEMTQYLTGTEKYFVTQAQ